MEMKKQRYINNDFRIFELTEDVGVYSSEYGHKKLTKGYRFIGFYYADKGVWISNTDFTLNKKYVKELYDVNFTDI